MCVDRQYDFVIDWVADKKLDVADAGCSVLADDKEIKPPSPPPVQSKIPNHYI